MTAQEFWGLDYSTVLCDGIFRPPNLCSKFPKCWGITSKFFRLVPDFLLF